VNPEESVTAQWQDEDRAFLLKDDGELLARLHIEPWHPDGERTPHVAWVVSWLDPDATSSTMLRAPVEVPALGAADQGRCQDLVAAALAAIAAGPPSPAPRAAALSEPPDYAEQFRQLELLIDAWDRAQGELGRVLRDHNSYLADRYIALSDVLARTYAVDRTMQKMWERLPVDIRDDASHWADEAAVRAIAHNTEVQRNFGKTYNPRADVSFDAYFLRERNSKPYHHWSNHLLSGSIQEGFFMGLRWVRGQMTYLGVIEPIELWQYEAGVEPRWKWRDAPAITTGLASNARERAQYERFQAGKDVLGLFSHLLTIFWEAKWSLRKHSKRAELRRPGAPPS